MSSQIWQGDNWRYADDLPRTVSPTRHMEQVRIDTLYAAGKMNLTEWSKKTNELSDLTLWAASGRIKTGTKI